MVVASSIAALQKINAEKQQELATLETLVMVDR
jgi:hypothetical protein